MFGKLPIVASVLIQVLLWFLLLVHFGVRSDYRSTKDNRFLQRIHTLDANLGVSVAADQSSSGLSSLAAVAAVVEPFNPRGVFMKSNHSHHHHHHEMMSDDEDDNAYHGGIGDSDDSDSGGEYDHGAMDGSGRGSVKMNVDVDKKLQRKSKLDLAEIDDLKITNRFSEEVPLWKQMAMKVAYYPKDVYMGIRKHYFIFGFAVIVSIILPLIFVLTTCSACITNHPLSFSTAFGRKISPLSILQSKDAVCPKNSICHSYLTVPKDMSTSMILNFHIYSKKPSSAQIILTEESAAGEEPNAAVVVPATVYRMSHIPFTQRYQGWADLVNLKPNTVYTAEVKVVVKGKQLKSKQRTVLKFKTAPSASSNENVTFVSGGDMEWTRAGIALSEAAARTNPLFAIVGGDIGYENGMAACFMRMDEWFYNWNKYMITPNNMSIPILTAMGNHEAGGFKQPRSNVAFYFHYFPHQIGLQKLDPQKRSPYHEHIFGKHTFISVLDSYVVTPIPGEQTKWLNASLSTELLEQHSNRFAVYHASAYPVINKVLHDITVNIRQLWVPLFEKHNFKAVFENHYHALLETHPIRNNTVDPTGVRYLGSGAWGLSPRSGLYEDAWYAENTASLAHLYVATCGALSCQVQNVAYDTTSRETFQFSTHQL